MHRQQKSVVVVLALALTVATACGVNKEVHQKALNDLAATQNELTKTRKERDQLKRDLGVTEGEKGQLAKDKEATEAELAELRKQREATEKRLAAFRELKQRFAKLVDTGKLEVGFRKGQMLLKLPSSILFPSGKAELTKAGEAALGEVTTILLDFKDRRFLIAGYTDTDPIKSRKFKSNWELSTARAVSVVQFMIESGFPPSSLGAAGYGEFDPVAPNDTEQNKQLNRRIEIILVPNLSELPTLTGAEP